MISIRSISLVCFFAISCNVFSAPKKTKPLENIKLPVKEGMFKNWVECIVSPAKFNDGQCKAFCKNIDKVLGDEQGRAFRDRIKKYCEKFEGLRIQDVMPAICDGRIDAELADGQSCLDLLDDRVDFPKKDSPLPAYRKVREAAVARPRVTREPKGSVRALNPNEVTSFFGPVRHLDSRGKPTMVDVLSTLAHHNRSLPVGSLDIKFCGICPDSDWAKRMVDCYLESELPFLDYLLVVMGNLENYPPILDTKGAIANFKQDVLKVNKGGFGFPLDFPMHKCHVVATCQRLADLNKHVPLGNYDIDFGDVGFSGDEAKSILDSYKNSGVTFYEYMLLSIKIASY